MSQSNWNTGLCACTIDPMQTLDTICCPCCAASRQWNAIDNKIDTCDLPHCLISAVCMSCSIVCIRFKIVEKYHIDEATPIACCIGLICASCSLCQTHRELSARTVWPGGTLCHKQPTDYDSLMK
jgi:Cys-rich protein (TIGR01571 family)